MTLVRSLACLMFLVILPELSLGQTTRTVFEDETSPGYDPGDTDHYLSIQDAVNASGVGDTVLVTDGDYFEAIDLSGKEITLESDNGASATTIDADGEDVGVDGAGDNTTVRGFTITGANRNGVRISGGGPLITENIITGNGPEVLPDPQVWNGGGVSVSTSQGFEISDNEISLNVASYGGGIAVGVTSFSDDSEGIIEGNDVNSNQALRDGGGIYLRLRSDSVIDVVDNTISGNETDPTASAGFGFGGGLYVRAHDDLDVLIDGNEIEGNECWSGGAGVFLSSAFSTSSAGVSFTNNDVHNNEAIGAPGGGLAKAEGEFGWAIEHNTIYENTAHSGAGVWLHDDATGISHCTIRDNTAEDEGGGVSVSMSDPDVEVSVSYATSTATAVPQRVPSPHKVVVLQSPLDRWKSISASFMTTTQRSVARYR